MQLFILMKVVYLGCDEMQILATNYLDGESYCFHVEDGRFISIEQIPFEKSYPILSPGFQDIQINGFNGLDFNDHFDFDYANDVLKQLLNKGIHSIYPTIITNSEEQIISLGKQILNWRKESPLATKMVRGIHLEGPYISPKDGARGAHSLSFVRPPNLEEFQRIQHNLNHFIKILTISPEWKEAIPFIRNVSSSVIVAIGHTTALPEEIHAAAAAGATLSTHFGNGVEGVLPRHPNYLWAQLAEDKLFASVISDGFHLDSDVLKVTTKMKQEKLILVSDAVSLAGKEPGEYKQPVGGDVTLSTEGKLFLRDSPQYLAGSAMDIFQCARKYQEKIQPEIIEVVRCMTKNIEMLFGHESPIQVGNTAEFILTNSLEFSIEKSFINGKDWVK